jgi:hypothetical protein
MSPRLTERGGYERARLPELPTTPPDPNEPEAYTRRRIIQHARRYLLERGLPPDALPTKEKK